MDEERFARACARAALHPRQRAGIGTLSEKTLHATLKHYYEPDTGRHEVPIAGYVADILRPEGIVEIQTGSFDRLRPKLAAFLPSWPVMVVYPVACTRYLCWVDPDTGAVSEPRKTRGRGQVYDILPELYKLKLLLPNDNLTICVAMLELEEYKYLNGYGKQRKIRAGKCERIPLALQEEVYLGGEYGYGALLPPGLPPSCTTADYRQAARVPAHMATTALNILHHVGTVERVGKQGNAFVYKVAL